MPDSEQQPRDSGAARAWSVAIVTWLAILSVVEIYARHAGYAVTREDPTAVSLRHAIDGLQSDDLVVIASSEGAAGIDLEVLSSSLHRRVRMLSMFAVAQVPIFEALLERRPDFHGDVVVDISALLLTKTARQWDGIHDDILAVTPPQRISDAIANWFADRFVFRNPNLDVHPDGLEEMFTRDSRRVIRPSGEFLIYVSSAEHYRQALEDMMNARMADDSFKPDPANSEELRARIQRSFATLRARGGGGMMIYFPVQGPLVRFEATLHSRESWNRFAAGSSVPTLNLADVPDVLAAFQPIDGAHLEADTRGAFTRVLAKTLAKYDFAIRSRGTVRE